MGYYLVGGIYLNNNSFKLQRKRNVCNKTKICWKDVELAFKSSTI